MIMLQRRPVIRTTLICGPEQVHEGGVGERAEPGDERERVEPRPDRVCARGDGPAGVCGDLERVGAELEPVVR